MLERKRKYAVVFAVKKEVLFLVCSVGTKGCPPLNEIKIF